MFTFHMLCIQNMCRLPFAWNALYVDWLYHMLWELCEYSKWMRLPERCWWSRATATIHNGFDCAGIVYCDWNILQCFGGYNGWTADLAAALSHTCKTNANKSKLGDNDATFFLFMRCYKRIAALWCTNFLASTEPLKIDLFQATGKLSKK